MKEKNHFVEWMKTLGVAGVNLLFLGIIYQAFGLGWAVLTGICFVIAKPTEE